MPDFLARLLIVALILFILQIFQDHFGIEQPMRKILFAIALVIGILWILFGHIGIY